MSDPRLINDNAVLISMDEYVRLLVVDRNFDALTEAGVEKWAYNVSAYHDAPPTPSEKSVREELTAEDAGLLPRVWVARTAKCGRYWRWSATGQQWDDHGNDMWPGFIFVPGHLPKPTIDPADMTTIATCSKVDWT